MAESLAPPLALDGPEIAEARELDGRERRRSGNRTRARDRMMDRASRDYPESDALRGVRGVENLVLFIDDDLRETGMALGHVEAYLVEILRMLEGPRIKREDVHALASDTRVLDHVDMLVENLETLRRRLTRLATSLR
ncbi:hypothetical protein [Nannocystis pusilla]|uniref:Uncharacterized protein n=1 Tax=Nannocystis pusilla TaxID=889268 RepID=A0ABS7U0R3_9BACT|nr:hypothetical protein [Nannocystis pusilla]MBZ5714034.1 hypothetical protein [Nannocystis pusilla]